jgi:antitoxin Phd
MKTWTTQEAQAQFSELVDACAAQGPQLLTQGGTELAVLVSAQEWHRVQAAVRPTPKEFRLADPGCAEFDPPPRGQMHRRPPPDLD